jgi:hypothetical protein
MFRGYANPDDISVRGQALYRVYKGQHLVWRKYGFIECEFETYFDSYVAESFGVLSVGSLKIDFDEDMDGEFGGLEAYVIDWYLDGVKQFSTGYGLDGQGYYAYSHPFEDVDKVLNVQSGTWIPRVRFVDVDGVRFAGLRRDGVCGVVTQRDFARHGQGVGCVHDATFVGCVQACQVAAARPTACSAPAGFQNTS